MPRFGGYESVQELLRTPLGSVFSARPAGESREPTLVVRTCQPSSAVAGEEAARKAVRAFVEQAQVQQRAAGGGTGGGGGGTIGTHWARIYEIGELQAVEEAGTAGAYVVTDLAPRGSLERLVNARVRPTGRQLATVVGSIVEGLREIRVACGRGHGDLRLTNVLLLGKGDFAQSRVVLCDPAPGAEGAEAKGGGASNVEDLRALGEIIHALVVHQGSRGVWPIAPSGAWSALGASGNGWRELAQELLNPDEGAVHPSLEDLAERVARLRAARSRRGPALIAGAVTLLTIGVGVWLLVGRGGGGKPPPPPAIIVQWLNDAEAPVRWKAYCEEYRGWFAAFVRRLDEPPPRALRGPSAATRREVYQRDTGLAAVLARLESAGLIRAARSRAGDATYADPWSLADVSSDRDLRALGEQPSMPAQYDANVKRVKEALPVLVAAREGLRSWAGGERLGVLGEEWSSLGWRAAAEHVAGLSKALREGPSADAAVEIDAALGALSMVERIERVQVVIGRARGVIEGASDPVLSKFGAAVGPMAAGSGGAGEESSGLDALTVLEARLKSVAELAVELEQFVKQRWGTIDAEAFQESAEYRALSSADPPVKSTYEAWLYQAPGFRALTEPDPRGEWSTATMLGPLNAAMTRLAALGGTPPEGAGAALAALGARIEGLAPAATKWNRNNRERIEREAPAIRGELAALQRRLDDLVGELTASALEARERIRTMADSGAGAPAADALWRAERDRLLVAFPSDEQTPQLVREERAVRETLAALVERVRGAGERAALSGPLAAAADEHAAGLIDSLLRAAPAGGGGSAPTIEDVRSGEVSARAEGAVERQAAFVTAMSGLAKTLAVAAGGLALGYGVDEPLASAEAGVNGVGAAETVGGIVDRLAATEEASRFAGVREALAPLKERVAEARRLARETDVGLLAGEVAGAGRDRPERALAAWRRLGQPEVGWPSDASQLAGAERLRSSLEQLAAAIADAARSEVLRARTRGEFRERYLGYLDRCGSAACLEAGLMPEVMQGFGVEAGTLPPQARYNLLLRDARATVRTREGIDDAEAARMIGTFVEAARGVDAGVAARPSVRGLLDDLSALIGPEPPKPKIDPVTLGPGSAGWPGAVNPATGGLTFTRAGTTLEFLRFEGDEGRGVAPFYLGTTEVSLALFRALVGERWDELAAVLPPPETEEDDAWQGPRVWKHDAQGRFIRNTAWVQRDPLMTRQLPAFAAILADRESPVKLAPAAGGDPRDDHPVQRLPPAVMAWAAKGAGCRVPSAAEWQLACRAVNAPGPSEQVNLRDAAFAAQRDYTREARSKAGARIDAFKYPDAGIAGGQASGAPAEQLAQVHGDWNDGFLFFAPVGGGSLPLRHLIGNVCEFVFEKPELLDALPAGATIDQAASVLAREEGEIRAIGGSALSPPSVPLDQAAPVGMSEEGYADLGFRLCFSAAGTAPASQPLVSKFARLLTDDRYLLAGQ